MNTTQKKKKKKKKKKKNGKQLKSQVFWTRLVSFGRFFKTPGISLKITKDQNG